MKYPVPTVLFLITRARASGYPIFARPGNPMTTFQFIPPKEAP